MNTSNATSIISNFTSPPPSAPVSGFAPDFHTTLIIIAITIVLVNGFVIYLFAKWLPGHQPGNWLLLSLACADLMTGLVALPLVIITAARLLSDLSRRTVTFVMILTDITTVTSSYATIFSLCAIASERYIFLCNPLSHRSWISTKRARIITLLIWLWAIIFALIPLTWGHQMFQQYHSMADQELIVNADKIYSIVSIILFYFIPLALLTVAFIKMFVTIHHLTKTQIYFGSERNGLTDTTAKPKTSVRSKNKRRLSGRDKRAAILFATMVSMFIISWTPYMTVRLLADFSYKFPKMPKAFIEIMVILRSITSILNPILYTLRTVAFQEALKKSGLGSDKLKKIKLCPFNRKKDEDDMLVEPAFATQQSLL